MRSIRRTLSGLSLLALLSSTAALAQENTAPNGLGFGLKAGFGTGPGQAVVGAQFSLGKGLGIFRMIPNAHVGIGDDTTVDVNLDFLARFILADSNFGLYAGAAPTLVFGDDTEFGGNLIVGTQLPIIKNKATNLEARFGLGGVPDFRLLLTFVL